MVSKANMAPAHRVYSLMGNTNMIQRITHKGKAYCDECRQGRVQSSMGPEWEVDLLGEVKQVFPKKVIQSADLEKKESVSQVEAAQRP